MNRFHRTGVLARGERSVQGEEAVENPVRRRLYLLEDPSNNRASKVAEASRSNAPSGHHRSSEHHDAMNAVDGPGMQESASMPKILRKFIEPVLEVREAGRAGRGNCLAISERRP